MTANEEEIDESNRELDEVWNKAIYNARKAFKDTFEEEGYDAAYWTIKIISHGMSSGLTEILETKTWDEYGSYNLKNRRDEEE